MDTKTQRAKRLYERLRKDEEIDIIFTGLYKGIWVSSKRKAYLVEDLGLHHLSNIVNYYHAREEEVPPIINVAYKLKQTMSKPLDHIRVHSLKVHQIRRGRFIRDPHYVPPEMQDENILWVDEPLEITAVMDPEFDIEIPVLTNPETQLTWTKTVIDPREEQ